MGRAMQDAMMHDGGICLLPSTRAGLTDVLIDPHRGFLVWKRLQFPTHGIAIRDPKDGLNLLRRESGGG